MDEYTPDNWVVIKLTSEQYGTVYKILAGWSGGYATGDSWRMNSGIVRCEETVETSVYNNKEYTATYYNFYGSSGSCYKCHKEAYGLRMNNAYIWNRLEKKYSDKVQMMNEDTNWLGMEWIVK